MNLYARRTNNTRALAVCVALAGLLSASEATARVDGLVGKSFNLVTRAGHISTADGMSPLFWGFANADAPGLRPQYPGPTLIVNQGDTVTVTLKNALPVAGMNASILFPGQANVTASNGVDGALTKEAPPDGVTTVTYTFTATNAGTYYYQSGTRPELQVEMGLVGAIIVRPYGYTPLTKIAYPDMATSYDYEYLFLLTEMDPRIHFTVEWEGVDALEGTDYLTNYTPNWWFINGRNAPDTMLMPYVGYLPNQPYNCMPRMNPGGKLLMRLIGGGRDLHPFHYHGNNAQILARNGRLLQSAPGAGPDLQYSDFTTQVVPGETVDQTFEWTGKDLGWDVYGTGAGNPHDCTDTDADDFDDVTHEYCPDHGKPIPVKLPEGQELTYGGFYSGSPYLGLLGQLPPGEGGLNPNGGYTFMWHSHNEREMTNFDIFPGGLMTMLIVEPPGVPID